MHVANFSKSEIFFIGIKMWLKIVPFVNSDFQFSSFFDFFVFPKNNPRKEHENYLGTLSKLLKRLFNTSS